MANKYLEKIAEEGSVDFPLAIGTGVGSTLGAIASRKAMQKYQDTKRPTHLRVVDVVPGNPAHGIRMEAYRPPLGANAIKSIKAASLAGSGVGAFLGYGAVQGIRAIRDKLRE